MSNIFPLEINLERNKKVLNIVFSNNKTYSLSAELLRVESPSAEVQGHGVEKILILNKELIQIENIESVGFDMPSKCKNMQFLIVICGFV